MLKNDDLTRINVGLRKLFKGIMFPDRYRGGIFSIEDEKLIFTTVKEDGATKAELFGENLPTKSNQRIGGLTDIAQLHDGSILLSDKILGAIYRVAVT